MTFKDEQIKLILSILDKHYFKNWGDNPTGNQKLILFYGNTKCYKPSNIDSINYDKLLGFFDKYNIKHIPSIQILGFTNNFSKLLNYTDNLSISTYNNRDYTDNINIINYIDNDKYFNDNPNVKNIGIIDGDFTNCAECNEFVDLTLDSSTKYFKQLIANEIINSKDKDYISSIKNNNNYCKFGCDTLSIDLKTFNITACPYFNNNAFSYCTILDDLSIEPLNAAFAIRATSDINSMLWCNDCKACYGCKKIPYCNNLESTKDPYIINTDKCEFLKKRCALQANILNEIGILDKAKIENNEELVKYIVYNTDNNLTV